MGWPSEAYWQALDNLPPEGALQPRWPDWILQRYWDQRRRKQRQADLETVVRDQQRYIRSLEEQLAPHLVRKLEDVPVQEALA